MLHLIEDDLGQTGDAWVAAVIDEEISKLEKLLRDEAAMDEHDR